MNKENNNSLVKQDNKNIELHNTGLKAGSILEGALNNLSREQTSNLMSKAAEEALRLEVKAKEQQIDYYAGKNAALDHAETFNMLQKEGNMVRQKVSSEFKTGAGNMKIESKSGATCFVASVAYDNPNHSDVMFLRWFRDNKLQYSSIGKKFINWYWKNGPKLAKIVEKSTILKKCSRFTISLIIRVIKLLVK